MSRVTSIRRFVFDRDLCSSALIISALVLLSTENLFHYPIAIMSLLGVLEFFRRSGSDNDVMKNLFGVFLLIWVPMVLASVQATNPIHSWKTTATYLHFLTAAYYIIQVSSRRRVQEIVTWALVLFCSILVIDGVIQFAMGRNILGYPLHGDIVTGMFHPKQRLALFLAVLTPICLHFCVNQFSKHLPTILVSLPYVFIVLVSLKRNAWLMLLVGLLIFGLVRYRGSLRRLVVGSILSLLVLASVAGIIFSVSTPFNQQVQHTIGLVSGDFEIVDNSSNYRLSLWTVGLQIFSDNPIVGVGPRGYRYDYENYARSDNFWIERFESGQTHPHLMSLEILVETGAIGLIFYFSALVLLLKIANSSVDSFQTNYWLIGAIVAWLPFNTHLAFYGSYWASFVWVLIALGIGRKNMLLNEIKCG